jgi:hypothetical protein
MNQIKQSSCQVAELRPDLKRMLNWEFHVITLPIFEPQVTTAPESRKGDEPAAMAGSHPAVRRLHLTSVCSPSLTCEARDTTWIARNERKRRQILAGLLDIRPAGLPAPISQDDASTY